MTWIISLFLVLWKSCWFHRSTTHWLARMLKWRYLACEYLSWKFWHKMFDMTSPWSPSTYPPLTTAYRLRWWPRNHRSHFFVLSQPRHRWNTNHHLWPRSGLTRCYLISLCIFRQHYFPFVSAATYGGSDANPNFNIQASFGAIKLIPEKNQAGSLCQETKIPLLMNVGEVDVKAVSTGCPASGTVKIDVTIPVAPLPGTVKGLFQIYKTDKSKAICLNLEVKV